VNNGTGAAGEAPGSNWQEALQRYFDALSEDERDRLRARTLRALDRATGARPLRTAELARLSALADYLAPRIARRLEPGADGMPEAVMLGLMAGYQLALGDHMPQEPDPFAE
jgi:hypothetical protein